MNAADFFSYDSFLALKRDVNHQKIVPIAQTPYGKKIKRNGNHYEVQISTGKYYGTDTFYISGWIDHAYTSARGIREIGGGNYLKVDLTNYEAFKTAINKTLSKFPDYTPEENEQLSLF